MKDLSEDFEKIYKRFCDPDFLDNKGLSNEVGIYVYPYDPADEISVRKFFEEPKMRDNSRFRLIECNLYKIFLSICQDKRILEKIPDLEAKKGSKFLLSQFAKIASPEVFASKMRYENHKKGDILLISGVGEVYPFARAHQVLDNIQPYFNDVPVVILYPGEYDGRALKLFGKLPANNYYRAFNLL